MNVGMQKSVPMQQKAGQHLSTFANILQSVPNFARHHQLVTRHGAMDGADEWEFPEADSAYIRSEFPNVDVERLGIQFLFVPGPVAPLP